MRLDPDPDTAPHVRWIFAQRLVGHSAAGIARTLNALGVPPPSAHDRVRNPHRSGTAWTLRTVAAILANPRYTGRQVWKRQSIDHHETRPGDKTSRPSGSKPTRTWNPRDQWEVVGRLRWSGLARRVAIKAPASIHPYLSHRPDRYSSQYTSWAFGTAWRKAGLLGLMRSVGGLLRQRVGHRAGVDPVDPFRAWLVAALLAVVECRQAFGLGRFAALLSEHALGYHRLALARPLE
jgi:hypothetical protein